MMERAVIKCNPRVLSPLFPPYLLCLLASLLVAHHPSLLLKSKHLTQLNTLRTLSSGLLLRGLHLLL